MIDFVFESRQEIKFDIYDDDDGNDEFIGYVETTVGNLMGSRSQSATLDVKNDSDPKKASGKLIVRC